MKNLKLREKVHELKSSGTLALKKGYSPVNSYFESVILLNAVKQISD